MHVLAKTYGQRPSAFFPELADDPVAALAFDLKVAHVGLTEEREQIERARRK